MGISQTSDQKVEYRNIKIVYLHNRRSDANEENWSILPSVFG